MARPGHAWSGSPPERDYSSGIGVFVLAVIATVKTAFRSMTGELGDLP